MAETKTRAVVFDLFGTLVPNLSHAEFRATAEAMARAVGAPAGEFVHIYGEGTYRLRFTGELATTEANVEYVCERLGVRPEPEQVAEAVRLRIGLTRRMLLAPLPGALEALTELRESGYAIGLVSDCSSEVPLVWPETELAPLIDAPVFSCRAGVRKPDPRLYALACHGLGVRPEECLYVGDGSGRELSGALAVGMRAALIRVPYDESTDADRPEALAWKGLELEALADVLAMAADKETARR
jgi:putative hydrolase of the HAD superfamily